MSKNPIKSPAFLGRTTMEMKMATPNDYGMMWMTPNQMVLSQVQGNNQSLSTEMLQMDPSAVQLENPFYPMAVPPSFEGMSEQPMEIEGFLMMNDYETSYCDEPPKFITAATQTASASGRKIKAIKHPGLKLQTPIAYKCDTDPSVIPIEKDGMAICQKCGAIGVKHAFYTRYRKYCSLACARSYLGLADMMKSEASTDDDNSQNSQDQQNSNDQEQFPQFKFPNGSEVEESEIICRDTPLSSESSPVDSMPAFPLTSKFHFPIEDPYPLIPNNKKIKQELAGSYNWESLLKDIAFRSVPVFCFQNVPMADCWDKITVGMKVEVENRDCDEYSESMTDSFWIASVRKIAGYKALLRYEGFGRNDNKDFWVNLCTNTVHPVGWCATRGKPLIPPKTIERKFKDWKEFLVERLTGARTLHSNFYAKVQEGLRSRFRVGLNVEVVDKNRISQVCVAKIKRIVGKRLHVEYYNAGPDDSGFWCHEDSPLIHPVGWASRTGHLIDAPEDYLERCESGLIEKDDATDELFTARFQTAMTTYRDSSLGKFEEGMRLEAIDPLNLGSICVATVMKVLKDDYLMIRIDSYPPDETGADWFCYHSSSPCIFPPGFCKKNNITLTPPKEYDTNENFEWAVYAYEKSVVLAPESLFEKVEQVREQMIYGVQRKLPLQGFTTGGHLEATDLMDPRLVCVASVTRIVGRLLRVHFNGWEEEYDQWLDCESPDIFPVGWCELVCHKLEGPRCLQKPTTTHLGKRRQKKRLKTKIKTSPNDSNKKGGASAGAENDSQESPEIVKIHVSRESYCDPPKEESDRLSQGSDGSSHSVAVTSSVIVSNNSLTKEPETGGEPSGPDQSLPVSATPTPASNEDSNASSGSFGSNASNGSNGSNGSTSVSCSSKCIPRFTTSNSASVNDIESKDLNPLDWTIDDVVEFLKVNDCSAYTESFIKEGTDGKALLSYSKDQIMDVIGFKIGPTLKIYHLIQQLKIKSKKASMKKNFLNNDKK